MFVFVKGQMKIIKLYNFYHFCVGKVIVDKGQIFLQEDLYDVPKYFNGDDLSPEEEQLVIGFLKSKEIKCK
jgi:hypothetical protein